MKKILILLFLICPLITFGTPPRWWNFVPDTSTNAPLGSLSQDTNGYVLLPFAWTNKQTGHYGEIDTNGQITVDGSPVGSGAGGVPLASAANTTVTNINGTNYVIVPAGSFDATGSGTTAQQNSQIAITNNLAAMNAVNFYRTNQYVWGYGGGDTTNNSLFSCIGSNAYDAVFISINGYRLVKGSSGTCYSITPGGVTNYSQGGSFAGTNWSVVNGAGPAFSTYYTNAPLAFAQNLFYGDGNPFVVGVNVYYPGGSGVLANNGLLLFPVTHDVLADANDNLRGHGALLDSLNASALSSGTVPDAQLAANIARTNNASMTGLVSSNTTLVGPVNYVPGTGVIYSNLDGNLLLVSNVSTHAFYITDTNLNRIAASSLTNNGTTTYPDLRGSFFGTNQFSPNVTIIRNNTNIYFTTITNALANCQAYDIIKIGAITNNFYSLPAPIVLPPNVTISGSGSNLTRINFDTNCMEFTSGDTFQDFSCVSTNPQVAAFSAFLSEGATSNSIGVTFKNLFIDTVYNGISEPFSNTATNTWAVSGCYIKSGQRAIYQLSTNDSVNVSGNMLYGQEPTNFSITTVCISLAGGQNFITGNKFFVDANNQSNFVENIGFYNGGANSTNVLVNNQLYFLNTNNVPPTNASVSGILMEMGAGSVLYSDSSIPSSQFLFNGASANGAQSQVGSDWTKIGNNELNIIGLNGITVTNGYFYDILPNFSCYFSSGVNSSNTFFSHFYGYPTNLNFDFSQIPLGATNNLYFTNLVNGISVKVSAASGLWITNWGGANVCVTAVAKDTLIITNVGAPFNAVYGSFLVTSDTNGTYIGGYGNGTKNLNIVQQGTTNAATDLIFNVFGSYNYQLTNTTQIYAKMGIGNTGDYTTISNFWCAEIPNYNARGKQVVIVTAPNVVITNDIVPGAINSGPAQKFDVSVGIAGTATLSANFLGMLVYSNAFTGLVRTNDLHSIEAGILAGDTETNNLKLIDCNPNSKFWLTNTTGGQPVTVIPGTSSITLKP